MKIYCDICNSILKWEHSSSWISRPNNHHIWRHENHAICQYHGIRDREFLYDSKEYYDSGTTMCFIATTAYGTELDTRLDILRAFRDQVLIPNPIGNAFVKFYYKVSPPIADLIRPHEKVRAFIREILNPIVNWAEGKIK